MREGDALACVAPRAPAPHVTPHGSLFVDKPQTPATAGNLPCVRCVWRREDVRHVASAAATCLSGDSPFGESAAAAASSAASCRC